MNGDQTGTGSFGISHLGGMPITTTFGFVLLIVVAILVWMRIAFGSVSASGSVRA